MAERTTQSWTTAPHFFVTREVDAGALVAAREKFGPAIEKDRGVRLTSHGLADRGGGARTGETSAINASWTGEEFA